MKARDAAVAAAFSLCVAAVASYPAYDWVQGSSIDALFVLRDVTTRLLVANRLVDLAAQRADHPAAPLHPLDDLGRRRAEGVRDHAHLVVLQRNVELRGRRGETHPE